jgi:2,3-dihydroxyphenylpropionate 1,2-dioxygenase
MNNAEKLKSRINPKWDRYVLHHFEQGEAARLAGELTSESIAQAAGNGGQEIRTWLAMAGAMGNEPMRLLFYEPIDALITGMGAVAT